MHLASGLHRLASEGNLSLWCINCATSGFHLLLLSISHFDINVSEPTSATNRLEDKCRYSNQILPVNISLSFELRCLSRGASFSCRSTRIQVLSICLHKMYTVLRKKKIFLTQWSLTWGMTILMLFRSSLFCTFLDQLYGCRGCCQTSSLPLHLSWWLGWF